MKPILWRNCHPCVFECQRSTSAQLYWISVWVTGKASIFFYCFLLFSPPLHILVSPPSSCPPYLTLALSQSYPPLSLSNLKSSHTSLSSHTHLRHNFIIHHSWRPLSTSVYFGVCFVWLLIMHSMISLRGVISLPLRVFLYLSGSLLASLKLFCLCWYHSNEKARRRLSLSLPAPAEVCVGVFVREIF